MQLEALVPSAINATDIAGEMALLDASQRPTSGDLHASVGAWSAPGLWRGIREILGNL